MNKGELSPTPHFVVVYYQVGVVHPSMVLSYYVGYYPTAACDSQGYPGGVILARSAKLQVLVNDT